MLDTNLPEDLANNPPLELGDIVNLKPAKQEDNFEKLADEICVPFTAKLSLTPELRTRLDRVSDDSSKTNDEYIQALLEEHLQKAIGTAVISSPSWAKSKITGPRNNVHLDAHHRRMQ